MPNKKRNLVFCAGCKYFKWAELNLSGYETPAECKHDVPLIPKYWGYLKVYQDPAKRNAHNDCKLFEKELSESKLSIWDKLRGKYA